jgi:hypothetical protein
MATAQTNTPINHTTTAGFNAWFNEIITQLLAVGLTQTTDTGQISTGGSVAIPASSTSAGYTIWKFNDTLQSTSPVFLKLEFGSSVTITVPAIWITIGSGSNGSGTLTGTVGTRRSVVSGAAPTSTSANYVSNFCYNSTYGVLGLVWKQGAYGGFSYSTEGGFYIYRSNSSAGAASGDAVMLITNNTSATATQYTSGFQECLSFLTNTIYGVGSGTPQTPSAFWAAAPLMANTYVSTSYGGNVQPFPVFYATPVYAISAFCALGLSADFAVTATFSIAIIGSTALTFMSMGACWGASYQNNGLDSYVSGSITTFLALWM